MPFLLLLSPHSPFPLLRTLWCYYCFLTSLPTPVELKASSPQHSCNLLCIHHQSIYPIIVKYLYLMPPLGWESSEGLCLAPSRCSTYRVPGRLPPIRPRAGEHGSICHSGWGYRWSPHGSLRSSRPLTQPCSFQPENQPSGSCLPQAFLLILCNLPLQLHPESDWMRIPASILGQLVYHLEGAGSGEVGSRGNVSKGGRLEELETWGGKGGHMDLVAGSELGGEESRGIWEWGGGDNG